MSIRTLATEALLVRSVDYRDDHRIVTFLTSEVGKVGAVAYGARRSRRRVGGALQPFQRLRVVMRRRPGRELWEVAEAETIRVFGSVVKDFPRYAMASWVVELLRELEPDSGQDGRAFVIALHFLERLEALGAEPWLLVAVTLEVLRRAGLEPALDRCASCGKPAPPGKAGYFDPVRGVICRACGGAGHVLSGRQRKAALEARRWRPPAASKADLGAVAMALCETAHHHVGKELRGWALLRPVMTELTAPRQR